MAPPMPCSAAWVRGCPSPTWPRCAACSIPTCSRGASREHGTGRSIWSTARWTGCSPCPPRPWRASPCARREPGWCTGRSRISPTPIRATRTSACSTGSARQRRRSRHLTPRDQPPEHGPMGKAVRGPQLGGILLHPRADGFSRGHAEARHLALVANQRGDLPVHPVRHVHHHVGLVGAPVPELPHLVGLEPVSGEVLGKVQV